ncbi:MAG: ribonuclease J [Dehalococcoidales bacterium]|nr:ribonuclease J [Dehalococcoidales bacterium]
MTVMEYEDDIIIVDAGLMFPGEEMLGIDLVIPDISYLEDKKDKVRGIVITHGHEDHIGALPYILSQINVPVYATKLTQGLISVKLKEHRTRVEAKLHVVPPGEQVILGKFRVEFFPVCHSIPDSTGLIIYTPAGIVVHSGDFKLDYTPVDGKPTDLVRLAQLGAQGVMLLLSDSTYAELPGYTPSEMVVGESLDRIMAESAGRVIVTTFSSLISRVQQVINSAAKYGRRVFIVGRSMNDTSHMAMDLGYLNVPEGILGRIEELHGLPHNKVCLITTGSQGEPTSALVRMLNRDNRQVHVIKGDTVILSATPVPGNEALVNRTVDTLFKRGAEVFYDRVAPVHVHGHASQEELKLLMNLVRPKYFVPVHGEYRHLTFHAKLAEAVGIPKENIFILGDGDILEISSDSARITGKINIEDIYVDGLSVGDIGDLELHNRRIMSRDGIVVAIIALNKDTGKPVGLPDIVSRGFVDSVEAKDLLEKSRHILAGAMGTTGGNGSEGINNVNIRETLKNFFYEQTHRHPMILPVIFKV